MWYYSLLESLKQCGNDWENRGFIERLKLSRPEQLLRSARRIWKVLKNWRNLLSPEFKWNSTADTDVKTYKEYYDAATTTTTTNNNKYHPQMIFPRKKRYKILRDFKIQTDYPIQAGKNGLNY